MIQADVGGLGENMGSQWAGMDTVERDVPHTYLSDDADLKHIYIFGRKLGQGSFGVVYEATHVETKTQWAIKKVRKPEPGSPKVKMLEQEIEILKKVNHAHIIRLKEVYETAKMTYLVTELCVGGELKQLLQQKKFFTEEETRHVICSLADAIVYLHKRDIVHRDLKLENILVKNCPSDDGKSRINIKVTDFGLAVMTGGVGIENMMTDACGTLTYMAPEMMSGRGYSHWCDVWSIGVIMFMLLSGEPPFVSKTKATLLEEIIHEEVRYTQPMWPTVSDAAKNILTCLLKVDPAYRMSANQLLENPWITGDANMPAMPFNVLEMMRHYLEQEETGTQTPEDLSCTSSEDTQDPSTVFRKALTEMHSNCRGHRQLRPERESSSSCTHSTTTEPTNDGGDLLQNGCRFPSVNWSPPLPITTQPHVAVKPSRHSSTKQCRPEKKVGMLQKPGSVGNKAGEVKHCSSSTSKTGSGIASAACKIPTASKPD